MRKAFSVLFVSCLVASLAMVAVAVETGDYKDHFTDLSAGFSGSEGTIDWTDDPWLEIGESDGPSSGQVTIAQDANCPEPTNCLLIAGEGLDLDTVGASRDADLSVFDSAEFHYKVSVVLDDLLGLTDAILYVQITDGTAWTTLDSYVLALEEGDHVESFVLASKYLSKDFGLRFYVVGLLEGDVYIDQVILSGTLPPAPTTTSSTTTTSTTAPTTTTTAPTTTTTAPTTTTTSEPTTTTTTLLSTTTTTLLSTTTTTLLSTTTTTLLPTTTTTLLPTTTTTVDTTTTTTVDTTTTTSGDRSTTTTTVASAGTTHADGDRPEPTNTTVGRDGQPLTTTTSIADDTDTSLDAVVIPGSEDPPPSSGIRESSIGIQADFDGDRLGQVGFDRPQVLGAEIGADYSMAVEVIESSWVWTLVLMALIATAIVSGLDRRRRGVPAS